MNEDNTHTTIASNNIYELIRTTKKELVHISGCLQGRIKSKFEGGAVSSGGAENFSEIGDECTMYSLCKETFHNNCCILWGNPWSELTSNLTNFFTCFSFFKKGAQFPKKWRYTCFNSAREGELPLVAPCKSAIDWLRAKKLSANPKKTEFMVIGYQRRKNKIDVFPSLELNDSEIKRVEKSLWVSLSMKG